MDNRPTGGRPFLGLRATSRHNCVDSVDKIVSDSKSNFAKAVAKLSRAISIEADVLASASTYRRIDEMQSS